MHPEQTLGEYLTTWLADYAKPNVTDKTYERYERIVEHNIKPHLGHIRLCDLKPLQIQSFYTLLLREGRKKGGGLSPLTVQHVHRLLRKALHQAVRWEILDRNPADGADSPRVPRKEMHALDREGLTRLLSLLRGNKLYLPVLLAATTGMRRGEIMALRWSDLDLEARVLRVARSLQQTSAGLEFKEPKSVRGRRNIQLAMATVDALKVHRESRDTGDSGLVVCRPDCTPWPPDQLSAEFHLFAKRNGFAIRFHDLRLNVYSHVLPGMQEEAAAKVDAMMEEVLAG